MDGAKTVYRRLSEIEAAPTAHAVGLKKVLLSAGETRSAVTQIAVTTFRAGEKAGSHRHPTMDEHYLFIEGEGLMTVDGQSYECRPGDYLLVGAGSLHELQALAEMKFMTIGIAYDK